MTTCSESCLSVNDKGDNEIKLGTVLINPGIYLMTEENPGKPQLGDRLMKAVQQPSNQMGSHTSK